MSFQTVLNNATPFTADKFVLPDKEGQEVVLIVVSATFQEREGGGGLELAEEQDPLEVADLHHGSPHLASVRRESDLALEKPSVDVLVSGQAHAPHGRVATSVRVRLDLGDVHKELLVSGDRFWRRALGAPNPEPFLRMPIVYERAFGGVHAEDGDPAKMELESRNWAGVGFRGANCHDKVILTQLPNIEYPKDRQSSRSDRPRPAGLGVVSRAWQPRIGFAGTYDADWLAKQWPLLPADFDARHYQAAPADQQSRTLRGGEIAVLENLTPEGRWSFRLPELDIAVRLLFDDRVESRPLHMDTVLIDAQTKRVTLTSRAAIRTRRNRGALREVVLGHRSPAWLHAQRLGKRHIELSGRDTVAVTRAAFRL